MTPSRTKGSEDEDVIVTMVPLVTGTPRHVAARAGVDPPSTIVPPIGAGADTLMLEASPVVGPPTTQMSVTEKGIVKMTVPASAMLVVVLKNAPETGSFGVCDVYRKRLFRSSNGTFTRRVVLVRLLVWRSTATTRRSYDVASDPGTCTFGCRAVPALTVTHAEVPTAFRWRSQLFIPDP